MWLQTFPHPCRKCAGLNSVGAPDRLVTEPVPMRRSRHTAELTRTATAENGVLGDTSFDQKAYRQNVCDPLIRLRG